MQQLLLLDQQLAAGFYTTVASSPILSKILLTLGVGLIYLTPLILIFIWFVISRKAALHSFLAGALAWQGLNKLIAGLVDRPRPSMSQIGVKELIFHRPDTSFPSDHSAFLMALTVSFYLLGMRKLGHLFLAITLLVGIARVGIGVHFPADILAGWLIGTVVAYFIWVIKEPINQYLIEPLIRLAKRFKV